MLQRLLAVLVLLVTCTAVSAATVQFNDPGQSDQWYLDSVNFGQAWVRILDLPERGQIKVAVVDSGFDTHHVDLQENLALWQGINIVNNTKNLGPVNPHGTGTIGLLAATSGNGEGISQAAWTARAIPIRVSNRSDGAAYTSHLAQGIRYAADMGARVINVSYSGVNLGYLQRAALYAQSKGAVVFMAAGNDGLHHGQWTNHKQLVAVGSTDPDGGVSSFSSRGDFVDLVAPGRNILSLNTNDRTTSWSGTSFSSPIAASVASLVLTANPELAPWQVRSILFKTARDIYEKGVDPLSGYGLVDAEAAVAMAIRVRGRYVPTEDSTPIRTTINNLQTYEGIRVVNQLDYIEDSYDLPAIGTSVPEPGSLGMLMVGGFLVSRRNRPNSGIKP